VENKQKRRRRYSAAAAGLGRDRRCCRLKEVTINIQTEWWGGGQSILLVDYSPHPLSI
jgi:hypothetical protein